MGEHSKQLADQGSNTGFLNNISQNKSSSLLRDAINAVDAALGSDKKNNSQTSAPSTTLGKSLENKPSDSEENIGATCDIIERALVEMKLYSENDIVKTSNVQELQVTKKTEQETAHLKRMDNESMNHKNTPVEKKADIHPLQGKVDPGRTQRVRLSPEKQRPQFYQEPLVAILVIIQGPGLGAHKTIHEGNNSIGRATNQHIQLNFGDESISSEEQAFIRYDPQDRKYLFIPNLSKTNVVSINNEKPTSAVELKPMDIISMGYTRMAFVPFCGEEFDWSDINK